MNIVVPSLSVMAPTVKVVDKRGLNREQAAVYVGVCSTTFDRMIKDKLMPQPKKIYGRKVWDKAALDECFDKLPEEGKAPKKDQWDAD